ncbi:MAG: alanine--tRNA ligase, partial [bacterium]|nr:alanine--tRNA ligase [bacterium]
MKSQDIRQSFIDYFRERDHRPVTSAPLVPHGDATLLFTNAGMVQFKDSFLGVEEPGHPRAVSVQKCLRVTGKHNDIENVGPSPRHHTFFEMLGNFSFGDYFKDDAIRYGWELVTEVWGIKPEHLFATVYEEDDEAAELWRKHSTLPSERILRCGKADNFWAMGETGPCGPCSEIFVDCHPDRPAQRWDQGCDSGRYLEIWNLVFMQFERDDAGKMTPLPNPSIDTGAGLERVAAVLQGVASNYESDLFRPILEAAAELAATAYGRDRDADVSLRVIADHLRAVAFLLADGVIPGPEGRGYVLRRLLRRAVRHGMRIGFEEPFMHRLVRVLDDAMGTHYPELARTRQATEATVLEEEEKYLATRAMGARRVQEAIDRVRSGSDVLSGEEIFRLYDTYGQEVEAVREIAEEEKLRLDEEGFERLLEEQRQLSRDVTGELQKRMASLREALRRGGGPGETAFEGYDRWELDDARVLRLAVTTGERAEPAESLSAGQSGVAVVDRTAFYAEAGGQIGDQGRLHWEGGRGRVVDTQKDMAGTWYHFVEIDEGRLETAAKVRLEVDGERRLATERHHTATHLLHAALHRVLGEGARQAGSLVAPDRLRFDFTHNKPLTAEELERIEELTNLWVHKAIGIEIRHRDVKEALASGAMALFGEKYGDRVRTVAVPGFSLELCGGCHVRNTGEIGLVLITSERGIASGVRRLEAVTGEVAFGEVRQFRHQLGTIEEELGVPAERAPSEIGVLKGKLKELERELSKLRLQVASGGAGPQDETEVDGIRVLARELPRTPRNELRAIADTLRDKLGSGVVVVGSHDDGKVSLIVTVSRD